MSGERIRAALAELRAAVTEAGIETPIALALQDADSATKFARVTRMKHKGEIVDLRADFCQAGSLSGVAVLFKAPRRIPFTDSWKD